MLGEVERLRELLAKASPDWNAKRHGVIVGGEFHEYTNGSAQSQIAMFMAPREIDGAEVEREANAALALAAVNFLRSAAFEEMVRNDARYRWLRSNCKREWQSDMPHDKGAPSLDIDFSAPGHNLDTAIDTAMSAEGAGNGN